MAAPRIWRERIYRYRLEAGRCRSCGRAHYPPHQACPHCGSRSLDRIELPRTGRLLSYSVVYSVSQESRERAPIVIGLVDLGVARVIAEISDVAEGELRNGIQVEAVLRKVFEEGEAGLITYAVKFRPTLGAGSGG